MIKLHPTIVKFKDGRYAYRKFSPLYFSYVYLDLKTRGKLWWELSSMYIDDCKGTLEEVKRAVNRHTVIDYGEPI